MSRQNILISNTLQIICWTYMLANFPYSGKQNKNVDKKKRMARLFQTWNSGIDIWSPGKRLLPTEPLCNEILCSVMFINFLLPHFRQIAGFCRKKLKFCPQNRKRDNPPFCFDLALPANRSYDATSVNGKCNVNSHRHLGEVSVKTVNMFLIYGTLCLCCAKKVLQWDMPFLAAIIAYDIK